MKKYVLVTGKGDYFEDILKATTKEAAIQEALSIWNALSEHDRKKYDEAYIVHAPIDEGGNPDCYIEGIDLVHTIK